MYLFFKKKNGKLEKVCAPNIYWTVRSAEELVTFHRNQVNSIIQPLKT